MEMIHIQSDDIIQDVFLPLLPILVDWRGTLAAFSPLAVAGLVEQRTVDAAQALQRVLDDVKHHQDQAALYLRSCPLRVLILFVVYLAYMLEGNITAEVVSEFLSNVEGIEWIEEEVDS